MVDNNPNFTKKLKLKAHSDAENLNLDQLKRHEGALKKIK